MVQKDLTLEDLGHQYAEEAERLKTEIADLKKKRKNTSVFTTEYIMLSDRIVQKQLMLEEAEDIAYKLINYYRKRT